ncbi:3-deoxy-manno-octulosonate cytidylyltransferase [bacterium]|nr:3-deoxy-manno-octulosonate cytidylyltransferase [bacterium]
MKTIGIIPSRLGSTRFPEKPLAQIAGVSLVERVWRIAAAALSKEHVYVATDSEEISEHVRAFGGQAVMTSVECRNGTERVAEAVKVISEGASSAGDDIGTVINLQGDAPLVPPWVIRELAEFMEREPGVALATPALALSAESILLAEERYEEGEVGGTFVTVSKSGRALYFSKAPIPSLKRFRNSTAVSEGANSRVLARKHIGMYAYRREMLFHLLDLPQTPLEELEQLEQLRALEHDLPISVVDVDYRGRTAHSVDNPGDVSRVEEIIASEGELVLGKENTI